MSEKICHVIPDDRCQECESRRPIYTASQVRELVEEIAERVRSIPLELINEYTESRSEDGLPLLAYVADLIIRETKT